jgi:hypothetical protein
MQRGVHVLDEGREGLLHGRDVAGHLLLEIMILRLASMALRYFEDSFFGASPRFHHRRRPCAGDDDIQVTGIDSANVGLTMYGRPCGRRGRC